MNLRDIPAVNQLLGPVKQPATTLQLEFPPPNKALLLGLRFSNLAVLLILVTYFAIFAQGFATIVTFTNILNAVAAYLLVALGETFVLIGAGIDLSVGSMLSLGGVAAASYMSGNYSGHGSGLLVTIGGVVVGAGLGLVGGVFNGAAISYLKLNPLIVTLGTYGVFLGGADLISNGVPITNLPPASFTLGNGTVFHVPYIALIALGFAGTLAFVAKNTRFGRYTFAVGANRESVRRAGVNLNVHSMMLYGLAGMLAGLAGMLNASQFAAASSAAGSNVLLVAIAAVVIGGTPITGGEGKIWGTVIGALIYTLLQNGFVLMNKSSFWQLVIIGFLIIGAVYVDEYQRKLRIMMASGAELTGVAPPDIDAGPHPPTADGSCGRRVGLHVTVRGTVDDGSVLVTGAASGIGRGVARAAAAGGRRVVATDIVEQGLRDLELEGRQQGWALVTAPLDVAEPEAIEAVLASITADGERLGGLVHCAGITYRGQLLDMTMSDYHRVVETNLTGSFLCMTSTARSLVAQGIGGSIVVITSINAQRPLLSQAVYSACKAAVEVLVSTLALEVASAGVRVNAVAPGAVDTAMNPEAQADPAGMARIPLGRFGTPEEIARPVLFLLSDEARYITATSLAVDGGVVHLRP